MSNLIELTCLGWWATDKYDQNLIHPSLLQEQELERRKKKVLVSYLQQGHKIRSFLGFSFNRIDVSVCDSLMGKADCSDGKYVWPEGLAYYVENYNVALPDWFLDHVKVKEAVPTIAQAFEGVEDIDDLEDIFEIEYSFDQWEQWCDLKKNIEKV